MCKSLTPNSLMDDAPQSNKGALATEFESACQSRIAIETMKFAIRPTEKFAAPPSAVREANLVLLEAVGRLEEADRHFQSRSRSMKKQDSEALHYGHGIQEQTGGSRS